MVLSLCCGQELSSEILSVMSTSHKRDHEVKTVSLSTYIFSVVVLLFCYCSSITPADFLAKSLASVKETVSNPIRIQSLLKKKEKSLEGRANHG